MLNKADYYSFYDFTLVHLRAIKYLTWNYQWFVSIQQVLRFYIKSSGFGKIWTFTLAHRVYARSEDSGESMYTALCLGQDFWGTQVSFYLNYRGTFTNSGGHTKSFRFIPVKLNSYLEISVHFLFKFELDVDSFGEWWQWSSFCHCPSFEFTSKFTISIKINSFIWPSAMEFEFSATGIGLVKKSISNATFFIGKNHVPV